MDPESHEAWEQLVRECYTPAGTERWRLWLGEGEPRLLYAWLVHPHTSPAVVLRNGTVAGLRARILAFEDAIAATSSISEALAAAEAVET